MNNAIYRVFEVSKIVFRLDKDVNFQPYTIIFFGNVNQSSRVIKQKSDNNVYEFNDPIYIYY